MKEFILFLLLIINISAAKIIPVEYIDQTEKYPTGCESVSTVMCLKYHGFDITVDEFIQNYLEMGEIYYKLNKMFAPDPNDKFVGSPYDSHSYGCYEPVIEKALKKIIEDKNINNFEIKNLTNVPMETIIKEYIDNDMPVIFWATIDLKPSYEGSRWTITGTKEEFVWKAREHCLLLVGYDMEKGLYYFNDPWNNHGTIGYDMELVEKRHQEEYSMAVALKKKIKL